MPGSCSPAPAVGPPPVPSESSCGVSQVTTRAAHWWAFSCSSPSSPGSTGGSIQEVGGGRWESESLKCYLVRPAGQRKACSCIWSSDSQWKLQLLSCTLTFQFNMVFLPAKLDAQGMCTPLHQRTRVTDKAVGIHAPSENGQEAWMHEASGLSIFESLGLMQQKDNNCIKTWWRKIRKNQKEGVINTIHLGAFVLLLIMIDITKRKKIKKDKYIDHDTWSNWNLQSIQPTTAGKHAFHGAWRIPLHRLEAGP